MFSGYKYRFAKNFVLMQLASDNLLTKDKADLMRDIAGNPANQSYGVLALRHRVAKDKFSAAAAVFARLAFLYDRNPTNGLGSSDWRIALHRSLLLAGATEEELPEIEGFLIDMNRNSDSLPL